MMSRWQFSSAFLWSSNLLSLILTSWFLVHHYYNNDPLPRNQRNLQTQQEGSCGSVIHGTVEVPSNSCPCSPDTTTPPVTSSPEEERTVQYTTVDSPDWPSDILWQDELGALLSPDAHLYNNRFVDLEEQYLEICSVNDTGFEFMGQEPGICMIEANCRYQFCNRDGLQTRAIAAYTVDVRNPEDIKRCFEFANRYNIAVSVKTTGHNYVGASAVGSSLNIWMYHYPKDDLIDVDWRDSCALADESIPDITTIAVGGGELSNDVLNAAGQQGYEVVTGDHRSVGFSGFVVGVGVAYTSRYRGTGIDLVKRFEVVLPNATEVVADACTNPDLFWALRGGGGGTFGVITKLHYQIFRPEPITEVYFGIEDDSRQSIVEFMTWWTRVSPQADRRVAGGYWLSYQFVIYVIGDEQVARDVIADDLIDWFENDFTGQGEVDFDDFPGGWYEIMDGDAGFNDRFTDNPVGDGAGDDISTRLVPLSFILENREEVIEFLVDLYWEVENWDAYYFGQAMAEVAPDATAVHPAMREAAWAISTKTREGSRLVREFLPNDITGVSYNHHSPEEPNWRDALWGPNYERLLSIKEAIDPSNRMNCWHCVGYQGEEFEFN